MMSKPRDTLKTNVDELVLAKFFDEYIKAWYRDRAISAITYEKAKKELDLLTEKKKKIVRKNKEGSRDTVGDDVHEDKRLPSTNAKGPHTDAPKRPTSSKSDLPGVHPQKPQSRNKETNSYGKQHAYSKEEVDSQSLILENIRLEKRIGEMKEKICRIRADADIELTKKIQQLDRLKKALDNSKSQVDDLTMRLSKLAGDKLRDGNPNLADLSDPNRPTELGKRFSEIYDNEWSDAFETIAIDKEEKKVGILYGIVMKAFSFCEKKIEAQTWQVRAVLLGLTQEDPQAVPVGDKTRKTTNIHNCLKDLRKQLSQETAENVANEFLSATFGQYISGFGITQKKLPEKLHTYARKCAELCWLMVVCDPPMVLSEDKEGTEFDINVYKPYTKSVRDMKKPVVKLHVWPALRLHETGPFVAKGVAQPQEGKK